MIKLFCIRTFKGLTKSLRFSDPFNPYKEGKVIQGKYWLT